MSRFEVGRLRRERRSGGKTDALDAIRAGVLQDAAHVLSLTSSRSVPVATYDGNVLGTTDYSLIEPHTVHKFCTPGVGMLEAIALNGGREDVQLYTLEHNR